MLIAANRRRPNLGEFIKPTIPRRFVNDGPFLEPGSYPCEGARIEPCKKGSCDLCKHVHPTKTLGWKKLDNLSKYLLFQYKHYLSNLLWSL